MTKGRNIITRFAPSPTGYLHLGHAYSARCAYDFAIERGGTFLLRIENIDQIRCKAHYETALYEDLASIGLCWQMPVRRQSDHISDYTDALNILDQKGLLYPCFCTRKDIRREITQCNLAPHNLAPHNLAPHNLNPNGLNPNGLNPNFDLWPLYPKTCHAIVTKDRQERIARGTPYALRLDMAKALTLLGDEKLIWHDLHAKSQTVHPEILMGIIGDVVLARKDTPTSYHLSVVVDDHLQNISHVIRGQDLFFATHLHCLLQFLLGYQTPTYWHHKLLTDKDGNRYAKRNKSGILNQNRV